MENNTETELKDMGYESVDWVQLAHARFHKKWGMSQTPE